MFGGEAVFPLEIQFPLLRVVVHEKIIMKEKASLRLAGLETLVEDRIVAQQNLEPYLHGRQERSIASRIVILSKR